MKAKRNNLELGRMIRRLNEAATHHEQQWDVWEHSWKETQQSLDWLAQHPERIADLEARLGSTWAKTKQHNQAQIRWAKKQAALHLNRAHAIRSATVALVQSRR